MDFFYGFMLTRDAEQTLQSVGKKVGSYLMRFSNSERGGFTVSYLSEKLTAQHLRISRTIEGAYKMGTNRWETLDEFFKTAGKKTYGLKVFWRYFGGN